MTRQPQLPSSFLRDCDRAMMPLSDKKKAPVWLHLGAVAQHARGIGLVRSHKLPDALAELAGLHPGFADFASPMPEQDAQLVEGFWAHENLPVDRWAYPLGDLYQALSVEARKGRALCQTPWFVAELLLHLGYDRAREDWERPRVIDPACGTGHILVESLGWMSGSDAVETLGRVTGVDLDPYAALIARYRLAVRSCVGAQDLCHLPLRVGVANSLLDEHELLARGAYEVVIANPPYIVVAEEKMRESIRQRYREVCHGKYSLALPFTVLMTELAVEGGYISQITTNAWMKREYGKPFVENYLSRYELIWVINAAGAYIPGHGTPTCILLHRNMPATGKPALSVLGKRGEPKTPEDPAKGLVWSSIRDAVYEVEARERLKRAMEREAEMGDAEWELDLQELRAQAEAARARSISDPPMYFAVGVPGDVLLELVSRAEELARLQQLSAAAEEALSEPG